MAREFTTTDRRDVLWSVVLFVCFKKRSVAQRVVVVQHYRQSITSVSQLKWFGLMNQFYSERWNVFCASIFAGLALLVLATVVDAQICADDTCVLSVENQKRALDNYITEKALVLSQCQYVLLSL
jgi:hypothetical protein